MHAVTLFTLSAGLFLGQPAPPPAAPRPVGPSLANLNFSRGDLQGWEGSGFYPTAGNTRGPGLTCGACSSDGGNLGRKGMVRFLLRIPPGMGKLTFQAYAATPLGILPDDRLDVLLTGDDKLPQPRQVSTSSGWSPAPRLLSRWGGKPREYAWDVDHLQGRLVQIVMLDDDERPGCHVYAAGFRLIKADAFQDEDFVRFIVDLQAKHKLPSAARYHSKRYTALSNAGEAFSIQSVRFCESIYDLFYHHFQKKGFALRHPGQTLMLAVFSGPDGFDAYLGQKMPPGITGMYHQGTNRLVIYDQRENRALVKEREEIIKKGGGGIPGKGKLDKGKFVDSVIKHFDEIAKDINVSTTMHEAAHQLSFNCGLLNRQGDVAGWLAEGLACYCEATEAGEWLAIGAFNPNRVNDLRPAAAGKKPWIPLKAMVQSDAWLDGPQVLQGYAQSWALFRLLMEEDTPRLRSYLKTIFPRQAPEHRLEDFQNAFGDLDALEKRYVAYMRKVVAARPMR